MAEQKQRDVGELYSATDLIEEPEITPVLKGRCRMQGPVDETDTDSKTTLVTIQVPLPETKKFGGTSMSQKAHIKTESGTCNVCSAPCTSCMHLNQVFMGSERKEFSDVTCHDGVASQYSVNDRDVSPPFSSRSDNSPQQAADETSHQRGFNPGYFCETVENKSALTDASGASEDVLTLRKLFNRSKLSENQLPVKPWYSSDRNDISNVDTKPVEGQDDNISCVSSINGTATFDSNYKDRNKVPSSSVSTGSLLPEGSKKSIQVTENDRDDQDIPSGVVDSFTEANQVKKLTDSFETPNVQAPPLQLVPEDESEGSDSMEQDVKVCDICGDAGREDLLAICSRCTDGAEHTYCMREMISKVPEGDWLCEECKSADEIENQKQGIGVGAKCKVTSSSHVSDKSLTENIQVPSTIKGPISSKSCSSTKIVTSLRDSRFKNIDKGKGRLSRQISRTNSIQDLPESARFPLTSKVQSSKGTLLKSNSFNTFTSKPKVKVIDEVAIQKQKGIRESSPFSPKDGPAKMMGKSLSFRHANPSRAVAIDTKVKIQANKFSHAQNPKGPKHVKEGSNFDRLSLHKLDRNFSSLTRNSSTPATPNSDHKLTSCGEPLQGTSISSDRDLKVAQSAVMVKATGGTSCDGICGSSAEYKLNQLEQKEEPLSSSSRTSEKRCAEGHGFRHDGLARSKGLTTPADRSRESSVERLKLSSTSASRSIFCQKCKEAGHDADSCHASSSQIHGMESSMTRNPREEIYSSCKSKTAITSAMLKKPSMYRRNKGPDKPEDLSVSIPTSVDPSSFSDVSRKGISADGPNEGKAAPRSSSSDSRLQMISNNVMQLIGQPKGASTFKGGHLDFSCLSEANSSSNFPCTLVATTATCRVSVFPEHECIWKGSFEVSRGSQQPDLYGGLQAHLSSWASPRVVEMVKKFTNNILLSEVPRMHTWPTQFRDYGAKEDNIALFFFAEDPESYERSYKGLLDRMIRSDLALIGNFDGVELMIFPSNQLPDKSQRWNTLFYLWGVFRARSSISLNDQPASSLKENISTPKVVPQDEDIGPVAPPTCLQIASSNVAVNGNCHAKDSSTNQMCIVSNVVSDWEDIDCDAHSRHGSLKCKGQLKRQNNCSTTSENEVCASGAALHVELQPFVMRVAHNIAGDGKLPMRCLASIDRQGSFPHSMTGGIRNRDDEICHPRDDLRSEEVLKEEMRHMDNEAALEGNLTTGEDLHHLKHEKKRQHSDLVETASSGTSKKMADGLVETKCLSKKQKINNGLSEGNCLSDANLGDGFVSQNYEQGTSLALEDKVHDRHCNKSIISGDMGTAERFFFPVISNDAKDLTSGESSVPWKASSSQSLARSLDGVPNLDLALGAKTKSSNKGLLPFLVGVADKNDGHTDAGASKEKEDIVPGSLSLSLSFPFPDSNRGFERVSDTEQLLPESHHVNTSLLLYGGFSDK